MARDLYEILGIPRDASLPTIKRAYRKLVKRYHPDLNRQRGAGEMFLEVKEAYEVLSNPLLRREYDERYARDWTRPTWEGPSRGAGTPRKVRVPSDYVRVSAPFRGYRDRMEAVRDRQIERKARIARTVWRMYVVTVASMSASLAVFGGYLLTVGAAFSGGVTLGSAGMMAVLLLIAWVAKGMMAPEL